ncbi:hypothetical protein HMPREF9455_00228, partial [Dysgonomonas gadei ATCC BAA-286]
RERERDEILIFLNFLNSFYITYQLLQSGRYYMSFYVHIARLNITNKIYIYKSILLLMTSFYFSKIYQLIRCGKRFFVDAFYCIYYQWSMSLNILSSLHSMLLVKVADARSLPLDILTAPGFSLANIYMK